MPIVINPASANLVGPAPASEENEPSTRRRRIPSLMAEAVQAAPGKEIADAGGLPAPRPARRSRTRLSNCWTRWSSNTRRGGGGSGSGDAPVLHDPAVQQGNPARERDRRDQGRIRCRDERGEEHLFRRRRAPGQRLHVGRGVDRRRRIAGGRGVAAARWASRARGKAGWRRTRRPGGRRPAATRRRPNTPRRAEFAVHSERSATLGSRARRSSRRRRAARRPCRARARWRRRTRNTKPAISMPRR